MAIAAVIALLGDKDGGLNFAVLCADVHLAGLDIELMDGQAADAVFTGQLHDGIPCVEGGGGVGGGHAVAGVAADGADVADLGAAHHIHGLTQHVDILLDDGVAGNVGEAGQTADADVLVGVNGDAAQLVQPVDGDQLRTGALALAHLHQYVAAAGDDLGFRMLQTEGHRVFHAGGLV